MSTKHMTGFTHVHLPLVSDYSRVFSSLQDSLVNIQLFLMSTKVHDRSNVLASIFNSSEIAQEQCTSHITRAQHASYLEISRGTNH